MCKGEKCSVPVVGVTGWHTTKNDFSVNELREISNSVIDFIIYIDDVINDYEYVMHVIEKMDSGASSSMSGAANRIVTEQKIADNVRIVGFNGTTSSPEMVGLNSDGEKEFYVPSMPENLALLSAHSYALDGAVVLLGDGGVVLNLSPLELEEFKDSLNRYCKTKELCVNNRTYEVVSTEEPNSKKSDDIEAMSNTAVRFFNTKVNVSNKSERILTMLMTGLSFQDLYLHVTNGSLDGLPPDLTIPALNHFEHKYGRTPEIIQMAHARNPGHRKGLMTPRTDLKCCGERYEIDCMEPDLISEGLIENDKASKSRKLASHGGAIAGAVGVDCYSGFVHGKLLKSTANSVLFVNEFVAKVELEGWNIAVLAADSGVLTSSMFQVMTPAVEAMCLKHQPVIRAVRSEPYDHSLETGTVENAIGLIKRLIALAILLILRNPNLSVTGFTKIQVLKLWGEFFTWAITVVNLKPCPHDNTKSRYEVFMKKKPNMQNIRILPIGAIVMVYRRNGLKGAYNVVGLYVGPSLSSEGCARIAVLSGERVKILTTSHFSAASDGGGLNIYGHVNQGLQHLLDEQVSSIQPSSSDSSLEDPEQELSPLSCTNLDDMDINQPDINQDNKDTVLSSSSNTCNDIPITTTELLSEIPAKLYNENVSPTVHDVDLIQSAPNIIKIPDMVKHQVLFI